MGIFWTAGRKKQLGEIAALVSISTMPRRYIAQRQEPNDNTTMKKRTSPPWQPRPRSWAPAKLWPTKSLLPIFLEWPMPFQFANRWDKYEERWRRHQLRSALNPA
jgi:hypothetical protein